MSYFLASSSTGHNYSSVSEEKWIINLGNSKAIWEAQKDKATLAWTYCRPWNARFNNNNKKTRLQQQVTTSPRSKNSETASDISFPSQLILLSLPFVFPGFLLQAVQGLPTA